MPVAAMKNGHIVFINNIVSIFYDSNKNKYTYCCVDKTNEPKNHIFFIFNKIKSYIKLFEKSCLLVLCGSKPLGYY